MIEYYAEQFDLLSCPNCSNSETLKPSEDFKTFTCLKCGTVFNVDKKYYAFDIEDNKSQVL